MTHQSQKDNDALHESRELGAARLVNDVSGILHMAVLHSGLSQAEIADRLGVGASRVSQILSGEGNVRIATLGRFLGALGLNLSLELMPADKPKVRRRRNRPKANTKSFTIWEHTVITRAGAHPAFAVAKGIEHPKGAINSTGALIIDANVPVKTTNHEIQLEMAVREPSSHWAVEETRS